MLIGIHVYLSMSCVADPCDPVEPKEHTLLATELETDVEPNVRDPKRDAKSRSSCETFDPMPACVIIVGFGF